MKRVVITGFGIISSIGNNKTEVLHSLKSLKSGIVFSKNMQSFGLKSNVCGDICLKKEELIDRYFVKFMNKATLYAYLSMEQAIQDSGLIKEIYQKNYKVGIINGVGCNFFANNAKYFSKKKKLSPYFVIQSMFSNISAFLSTLYNIYGISYSMSSACATSSNCIINAVDLIKSNKQDIIFAGGTEELSCELSYEFDKIKILSRKYNEFPKKSSRPYDMDRDGFVISGGSGILVLEDLNHAISRKAKIYAEIIGYGICSDGFHMTKPSGSGLVYSMKEAINNLDKSKIDYINTHGTSTKLGDIIELISIQRIFKHSIPYFSSTKSLTGHALGASGVQEIIYILLMMYNNFIFPNINIDHLDKKIKKMNILFNKQPCSINIAMSNNCGFGGVNTSIILQKIF
ncbi:beta-ketoacyl synthase N-terminal-like domain-containing protein [Buchnera aphidicola]|uniref:beta-ketoacyl synthase N-terminal-like domain-containing protein n=1 Tax=Buchnera aphidicola TaxID=9 RepID=UPI003464DA97